MIELKACPFCGSYRVRSQVSIGMWVIFCIECNSTGPELATESEAGQAWNYRPEVPDE